MTDLTPEKRAELRAAVEERHLFRFVTALDSDGYPSSGFLEISKEALALLDAADERHHLGAGAVPQYPANLGAAAGTQQGEGKKYFP